MQYLGFLCQGDWVGIVDPEKSVAKYYIGKLCELIVISRVASKNAVGGILVGGAGGTRGAGMNTREGIPLKT